MSLHVGQVLSHQKLKPLSAEAVGKFIREISVLGVTGCNHLNVAIENYGQLVPNSFYCVVACVYNLFNMPM